MRLGISIVDIAVVFGPGTLLLLFGCVEVNRAFGRGAEVSASFVERPQERGNDFTEGLLLESRDYLRHEPIWVDIRRPGSCGIVPKEDVSLRQPLLVALVVLQEFLLHGVAAWRTLFLSPGSTVWVLFLPLLDNFREDGLSGLPDSIPAEFAVHFRQGGNVFVNLIVELVEQVTLHCDALFWPVLVHEETRDDGTHLDPAMRCLVDRTATRVTVEIEWSTVGSRLWWLHLGLVVSCLVRKLPCDAT